MIIKLLSIFIGGGLGSLARFGIGTTFGKIIGANFPVGTLVSNLSACIILGLFSLYMQDKVATYPWLQPLIAIGFCGGFSTFSTFSQETLQLITGGQYLVAGLNIVISITAGIGSIYLLSTSVK